VTLAVTLQLAGKRDIPLATRVFERIRYVRVRRAQLMGESNRNKWHNRDGNSEEQNDDVELPFPEWLLNFDAEKHAHAAYEGIASEIMAEGYKRPMEPLNGSEH